MMTEKCITFLAMGSLQMWARLGVGGARSAWVG